MVEMWMTDIVFLAGSGHDTLRTMTLFKHSRILSSLIDIYKDVLPDQPLPMRRIIPVGGPNVSIVQSLLSCLTAVIAAGIIDVSAFFGI